MFRSIDNLAQLIAEQFGIAEVNINYFTFIIYQTYMLTTIVDNSEPVRNMAAGVSLGL